MDKFFGTLLKGAGNDAQGFVHGLLSGLSPVVAERDRTTLEHQWLANDELAKQLDTLSSSALDPSHAAQYQQMATAIRTTPYGKKPPTWATDIYGTMQRQIASLKGQAGNPGPGAAHGPLAPLTPPPTQPPSPGSNLPLLPPDGSYNPSQQAQAQAQPQTMPPPPGAQAAQATPDNSGEAQGAPLEPPPGQTPAPPPQAGPTSTQAPQIGLGAQPGQPGTGFSTGAPPAFPAPPAIPGMIPSPFRTPESAAALDIAKTNALNAAETQRAKDVSAFQHKQELDTIYALSGRNPDGTVAGGGQGAPITWSTTAAGHTVAKPDLGRPVPGIVMNAQNQPVRLIRYNDPIHNPDREIPVPNYGGKIQLQKADGTAGWFAQDKSGNILGEITTPGAVAYAPAGYAPTVTDSSNQTVKPELGPDNQMHNVVETLNTHRTARKLNPGGSTGSGSTLAPPPGRTAHPATPPPSSAPRGGDGASASGFHGRDLGPTPAQFKMNVENPLKDWAAKNVAETSVTLNLVDRTMAALESRKNDNSPAPEAMNALLYKLGLASDGSDLLNKLNLGSIAEGGRLLKSAGGSRAVSVLKDARVHTPGSYNSFKLMYDKLTNIKQILTDINKYTEQEGAKYPGMKPPPGITNPKSISDPLNVL